MRRAISAQVTVVAHEMVIDVPEAMGILDDVHAKERQVSKVEAISYRCGRFKPLSGRRLAHYGAKNEKYFWSPATSKKASRAAERRRDDRLQQQARGPFVPIRLPHGTSAQRAAGSVSA